MSLYVGVFSERLLFSAILRQDPVVGKAARQAPNNGWSFVFLASSPPVQLLQKFMIIATASTASSKPPLAVGVIVNPASGRDMRRLLGWVSVFPTSEKVNVVLRLLSAMGSLGVEVAWMIPDSAGIALRVKDSADIARASRGMPMPQVRLLDMVPEDGKADSAIAAGLMRLHGVQMIAVLGGDGTHRAVATACADVPLATLSTGTNNAFPESWDATLVGIAGALVLRGQVSAELGLRRNKRLRVSGSGIDELALVDVCFSRQLSTGARAVWRAEDLVELFVTFAEPTAMGLSSIAALSSPVSRDDPFGSHVRFGEGRLLNALVMPGTLAGVSIADVRKLPIGVPVHLQAGQGTLAFDGEREFEVAQDNQLQIELDWGGPLTLAVAPVLAEAARKGLLFMPPAAMQI